MKRVPTKKMPKAGPKIQARKSKSRATRPTHAATRATRARAAPKSAAKMAKEGASSEKCSFCSVDLKGVDRALFVEEEVGRVFCSENCITSYFAPEIQRLEKEYFRRQSPRDLSGEEREGLAHLRWITLQEPDEIWREKTLSGDYRFTLISEFQPDKKRVWCICICLFLRGEPSFLYLAFSTRNEELVSQYRRGERVERVPREDVQQDEQGAGQVDGLADSWTEEETLRAQLREKRSLSDIPYEEFSLYQSCLQETLETPDEVWSRMHDMAHQAPVQSVVGTRLYTFIHFYPDEKPGVWYLVIARETEDKEHIEILDAFPTRDFHLVEQFRKGNQEYGASKAESSLGRVVH